MPHQVVSFTRGMMKPSEVPEERNFVLGRNPFTRRRDGLGGYYGRPVKR